MGFGEAGKYRELWKGAVGSLKIYYIEFIVDGKDLSSYKCFFFFTCDDDAHACERLSS